MSSNGNAETIQGAIDTNDAEIIRYAIELMLLTLKDGLGSGAPFNNEAKRLIAEMEAAGKSCLSALSTGPGIAVYSAPDVKFMQMALSSLIEQTEEALAQLVPGEHKTMEARRAVALLRAAKHTQKVMEGITGDNTPLPDVNDADIAEFTTPD